ncbi:hypothetical protein ACNQGP_16460 [Flavobacterium sp. GT2N3]|uniref:hypothetical protein n=1 Tax=unclassified Flavobacterium TaxID=196869 RepID=UPI003AAF7BC4
MLHSYFKIKNKHHKALNYIKDNVYSKKDMLSVTKKIKKLNDYQFYFLLCDLMDHLPNDLFIENTLELFFTKSDVILNTHEYLSLQRDDKLDDFVPVTANWVNFNNKNNLESLIDYFLKTKEYPKATLITKLLVLSDNIFTYMFHPVLTLRIYIDEYLEQTIDVAKNEKYEFFKVISSALDNELQHVLILSERIQEKIDSLSITNIQNENYLIDIDNEILKKLYFGLEKHMFIDQHKTTLEQFIDVLKLDWQDHNSVIHLEMDNIQLNFFIESMNNFLHTKIPLTFIERAKNIQNKNGLIKSRSVYTSVSKSKMFPKNAEVIKSIFNAL